MNRGGFSFKRAVGITKAKQRISRSTGIPLTKSGRQRKAGKLLTSGGCLINLLTPIFIITSLIILILQI